MLELFVSTAEQNSGKNIVTAGQAATMQSLGYSTGVYKPVDCGAIEKNGFIQSLDLAFVKFVDPNIKTYFSYLFKTFASPLVAAAAEKIAIDKNVILQDFQSLIDRNECLIVQGNDGLATPYGKNFLESDLIKCFDMPMLFVVSPNMSVNNIILSINHAISEGIKLRGVLINNYPAATEDVNIKLLPRLIEEYSDAKIMGILPIIENYMTVNPNDLIENILMGVDLEAVFQVRIAKLSY